MTKTGPRRILYVATEDWFFASHFLGLAKAARAAGHAVMLAARAGLAREMIEAAGVRVIDLPAARGASRFRRLPGLITALRAVLLAEKPDLVHAIALETLLIAGAAGRGLPHALVCGVTGLGQPWVDDGVSARAQRLVVRLVFAALRRRHRTRFLFENDHDPRALGFADGDARVARVDGAGVPSASFPLCLDPPSPPLRVAVVSRMIAPKGIAAAVAAVRLARVRGLDVRLDLWGMPDGGNAAALTTADLDRWSGEDGIIWRGRTDDVAAVWRDSHVAMLLSLREGRSRALIEAAASGRPIVTTDRPGCIDMIDAGRAGFAVPVGDIEGVVAALTALADPATRQRMGAAARAMYERSMTDTAVNAVVIDLYERLLAAR